MTTILFVDDIAEVREITQTFLESEGFGVAVAGNGHEALETLQQQRPDLIVSDILMPGMDGFELCRVLKSSPDTRDIPFLFYTSTFLAERDREFAATLGVVKYLTKPMRLNEFLAEINAVLQSPQQSLPVATRREGFEPLHTHILAEKLHKKSCDLDSARREIESRHAQFSRLVNTLDEPVAELSGDLRFVYANRALLEWLGVGQGQIYGLGVAALLGQEFHEAFTAFVEERQTPGGINERLFEVGVMLPGQRLVECRVTILVDEVSMDERYIALFARPRLVAEDARVSVSRIRDVVSDNASSHSAVKVDDPGIIGASRPLLAVVDEIRRVAPTTATVLIQGESGTGKELVANAIHLLSDRRAAPLIKVNCGAIPAGLFESELFGHERGAFTGAEYRRIGRFEQASGGTLFLDEVAELSAEMQVKLLRVLQEGVIERVGAESPTKVDVRLLAATNSELEQRVREGSFRLDLYYRLNVYPITMPPLRHRPEDVPLLAAHFLQQFAARNRKPVRAISAAAVELLQNYSWPGNIRQLQNVIERAVIVAQGSLIQAGDLRLSELSQRLKSETRQQTLVEAETAHILAVLDRTRWAIAGKGGAAELLGINPSTLRSRMKKHGIRRPDF